MRLFAAFFLRRMWILRHRWVGDAAVTLLLPLALYLSIVVSLSSFSANISPGGIPFRDWVLPGIIFVVVLITSYFPVFTDLFENRKLSHFYESIARTPNSELTIVMALALSLLPDVALKSLVAGAILILLSGTSMGILSMLGLLFFVLVLAFLIINLAVTLTLIANSSGSHLLAVFVLALFIIFSSGWIIPLESLPSSLSSVFVYLPTAQLLDGGRSLLFKGEITFLTWVIPLLISFAWLVLNSLILSRVTS